MPGFKAEVLMLVLKEPPVVESVVTMTMLPLDDDRMNTASWSVLSVVPEICTVSPTM